MYFKGLMLEGPGKELLTRKLPGSAPCLQPGGEGSFSAPDTGLSRSSRTPAARGHGQRKTAEDWLGNQARRGAAGSRTQKWASSAHAVPPPLCTPPFISSQPADAAGNLEEGLLTGTRPFRSVALTEAPAVGRLRAEGLPQGGSGAPS